MNLEEDEEENVEISNDVFIRAIAHVYLGTTAALGAARANEAAASATRRLTGCMAVQGNEVELLWSCVDSLNFKLLLTSTNSLSIFRRSPSSSCRQFAGQRALVRWFLESVGILPRSL